ncbi:nucleotide sugar dehydrogenase [Galbibacter pacificus]|uniref:Nucleotide sugar dehydrogenase n=1 Tax=Galbibacter pacificus TaxID=2996052 RepID=A0ABT6FNC8_9FLAO|nr:nucleotide sugar dehydrogenase [Galbibacter pacificus]MDG3581287.1 nucleotide sugar dehydrogenase [Galbibacter pacificus]MDG3584765.1 nucleotide sugar dehydrogenase [Galbibacter pacificus]
MKEKYKIAIVGLGYVGLPLAVEFAIKGFSVIGFDINQKRVSELKQGKDVTDEVMGNELEKAESLVFSSDENDLTDCNVYIITVPTPVDDFKQPDLRPLISASTTVGKHLKKGDIVVYESTTYPGCTEEDCVPALESSSGLTFNKDFFCGYSPERINPGDKQRRLRNIMKVTSGSTPEIAEEVDKLYGAIIEAGTHKASSIKVAEASKIIENTQRDINISLVNELALIFDRIGVDTVEVLEAAGTKWNFLPFRPGLVGGHCIGVDPYYLTHKAEHLGYHPQVILSGRRINNDMGVFIANKIVKLMVKDQLPVKNARALVLGITFKENCPDVRNSRVIDVIDELEGFGLDVDTYDPYANKEEVKKYYDVDLIDEITDRYETIVLAVGHKEFADLDFDTLKSGPRTIIYDVKSFLPKEIVTARL